MKTFQIMAMELYFRQKKTTKTKLYKGLKAKFSQCLQKSATYRVDMLQKYKTINPVYS